MELKLTAVFAFKPRLGSFCLLPAATPVIATSFPVTTGVEQDCLERIKEIFCHELLVAVCRQFFGWDTVELPASMVQSTFHFFVWFDCLTIRSRTCFDASISNELHDKSLASEPFVFPDPTAITSMPAFLDTRHLSSANTTVSDAFLSPIYSDTKNFSLLRPGCSYIPSCNLQTPAQSYGCISKHLEPSFSIMSDNLITISAFSLDSSLPKSLELPVDHSAILGCLKPLFSLPSTPINPRSASVTSVSIPLLSEGITMRQPKRADIVAPKKFPSISGLPLASPNLLKPSEASESVLQGSGHCRLSR
jgi:hypothetical protein